MGNGGADSIDGGAGNDVLAFANGTQLAQAAAVLGGAGWDEVRLNSGGLVDGDLAHVSGVEALRLMASGPVSATLGATAAAAFGGSLSILADATAGLTLDATALSVGTSLYALGSLGADVIKAGAGNDYLVGNGGADSIDGGAGNDVMAFANAAQLAQAAAVLGGVGWDELRLASGGLTDTDLARVSGMEALRLMASGPVSATLGAKAAAAFGGSLSILADATAGLTLDAAALAAGTTLYVLGSLGADVIKAGAGNDYLVGNGGADSIDGGAGNDVLAFANGTQLAQAAAVLGGAGWDEVRLNSGGLVDGDLAHVSGVEALRLMASGPVSATLGATAAAAFGGSLFILADATAGLTLDATALAAGTTLHALGSLSADTIKGGAGSDYLVGNGGADSIDGGAGADTMLFASAAQLHQAIAVVGGSGWDEVQLTSGGLADADLAQVSGIEALRFLDAGIVAVTLGAATAAAFGGLVSVVADKTGGLLLDAAALQAAAPLHVVGSLAADTINAGAGNDILNGNGGADVIGAGAGNDVLVFASGAQLGQAAVVDGGTGIDLVQILAGGMTDAQFTHVYNIEQVKLLDHGMVSVQIGLQVLGAFAASGHLDIQTPNASSVSIDASTLSWGGNWQGVRGNDTLHGGSGADTLDGFGGDDVLIGGGGADLFRFGTGGGHDVVQDFTAGLDRVMLLGVAPAQQSFASVLGMLRATASGAEIDLPDGSSLMLLGVQPAQLSAADFVFG